MVRIGQKLSPPKVVSRILGVARFNIRLLRKEKAPATAALSESGRVGLMTDREKPRRGVWSKGVAASYSEKLTDGSKEGSKHEGRWSPHSDPSVRVVVTEFTACYRSQGGHSFAFFPDLRSLTRVYLSTGR